MIAMMMMALMMINKWKTAAPAVSRKKAEEIKIYKNTAPLRRMLSWRKLKTFFIAACCAMRACVECAITICYVNGI